MNYVSTRKNSEAVSFKEAVFNGLTNNGGLYFPEIIPQLPISFFENIEQFTNEEIAFQVLHPFLKNDIPDNELKSIIAETINFPFPLVPLEGNIFALELYHGPTQAFKDVGARFMSRCMSYFQKDKQEKVTILVATSGDTGSAVANGFFDVPGVAVKILFPKGKVSPYQEYQMTSLGKNITALEVDGTFDDCQKLVKEAFQDNDLRKQLTLSSANSINVARLLPQMLYYFFAYKALKDQKKKIVVSVPSGNLGNISAGLLAMKMGLPIARFIAAHNANDTFHQYLKTGKFEKSASVQTYSNAMDVGNPSNFERIAFLYNNEVTEVRKAISGHAVHDLATLKEIKDCYEKNGYLLDPHGAVGKLALTENLREDEIGLFLETAHPQKFSEVILKVIPEYEAEKVNLSGCAKISMKNDYADLRKLLLL